MKISAPARKIGGDYRCAAYDWRSKRASFPPTFALPEARLRFFDVLRPLPPSSFLTQCSIERDFISPSMLSCARSRIAAYSTAWSPRFIARAGYSSTVPRFSENFMQPNDPNPPKPKPNVSATNATPADAFGSWDAPLQEEPEVGERNRQLQAPNRANTWAASQQPRERAMTGPRFEQTIMELQVGLLSFGFRRFLSASEGRMDNELMCIFLYSPNPWPPSSSSTDNPFAGARRELLLVTEVVVRWVTLRFSSTWTSRRSPPAVTAVFLSYETRIFAWITTKKTNFSQAHEHNRAYLQSLPETSYPLEPTGDAAEVNEEQRITPGGYSQR